MFRLGRTLKNMIKPFINISRRKFNVSVVGASCQLGRSVSFLLKSHPLIHRLTAYDTSKETIGIVKDLSHIPTGPLIEGCIGQMQLALRGCDLVVVTGGQNKKLGQTDGCLFKDNAEFVIAVMQEVLKYCPKAFIVMATEPINYTIPLASKVLESGSAYDKHKVFGVTGVETMKAQMWVSKCFQLPSNQVKVPVICGHSSKTILPLFSNIMPHFEIDNSRTSIIIEAIRNNDDETSFMCGKPSLSAAYATYCMTSAILGAVNGVPSEHVAFVANDNYGTKFFASPMTITSRGIFTIQQFEYLTGLEADYFYHAREQLINDIRSAQSYFVPTCETQRNAKLDIKKRIQIQAKLNKQAIIHNKKYSIPTKQTINLKQRYSYGKHDKTKRLIRF